MGVAGDQPDACQASTHQTAQEIQACSKGKTQHIPISGLSHAYGDHHHLVDDAVVLPDLKVHRIQPQVLVLALQPAIAEGGNDVIELSAGTGDPAHVDAGEAQRLQQIVDFAGAYPLDISGLDHRQKLFLGALSRFQQARKKSSLPAAWECSAGSRPPSPLNH